MTASEFMPNLQLAALDRVRFHEKPENRRTKRLLEKIEQESILRNPPIVADMENGDFLLLDGANRVSVFRELGYSHIPVQVVDYGDNRIQLKGWHHLLVDGRSLNLTSVYGDLQGVQLREVPHNRLNHYLELRQVYSILIDGNTASWGLFPSEEEGTIEIHNRISVLDKVVASYEGQSKLERVKLADFSLLPDIIRTVDHQLCLFPVLSKNELLLLAKEDVLIPTGLTRHLIPGRALGLNVELTILRDGISEEEKILRFNEYVNGLEMEGRIRFYEESVFVMNE